jgi:hypothetical protein
MRGTLKTAALEHYFPLLAVEHDCILSKNAEVTVAYRVVLPELFTLTAAEYEALHGAWLKALRVLPDLGQVSLAQLREWHAQARRWPGQRTAERVAQRHTA